ncbi:MAG: ABC transporter substrate-binding protein [Anaerolineae bacterium]
MKNIRITLLTLVLLTTIGLTGTQAQPGDGTYTVGYLNYLGGDAFKAEMTSLGYIEGTNITYLVPSFENVAPENFMASYMQQVQDMTAQGVDVFVTNVDSDATGIQSITGNIPIVFSRSDDPIATGAVADLVHPGGRITGVVTNRPHERRLQLLTEIKPTTDMVVYLYDPNSLDGAAVLQQVQIVADSLNVQLILAETPDEAAGIAALQNLPDGVDWLFLTPHIPYTADFFSALAAASVEHQAGSVWDASDPLPGYVVSYGISFSETDRQAAQIVDRVLRGADPADLPVSIAENYLVLNLEAAAAIGLEIPVGVLRQADQILYPGFFDTPTPTPGGN